MQTQKTVFSDTLSFQVSNDNCLQQRKLKWKVVKKSMSDQSRKTRPTKMKSRERCMLG